jgi:hypothetical protein
MDAKLNFSIHCLFNEALIKLVSTDIVFLDANPRPIFYLKHRMFRKLKSVSASM